ncbi:LysR substrate-binding domain-containing protein [Cohnella zeiphila]|uniref:LysR family transcriptional regulator n=1 Tax=Cohnella zeiphila TaxID=2761120 RepID=A0A7X0SU03_9BACL|nr:LysR family transcriptional regulator [Cohnella zeiphila]
MGVDLEWYRVFYWIAKTGSVTGAAARLHITQPAVSHTIKRLEERLGGSLFFRTSKGVRLTAEGETLLRYVEQAFASVSMGEKAVADMHDLQSGEIHIGASDTLCKYYLLPYLERFHEQYPKIRIHVTNRTTPETLSLLKDGKIDFGIVSLPAADPQAEFRTSSAIRMCLVGGKRYERLAEEGLSLGDLERYPLLLLEKGAGTRAFLDDYAARYRAVLAPEFELGSIDLLAQFAMRGFGLAFVIRDYVTEELEDGRLFEIPLSPTLPERQIGIAALRGAPLSAAAKAMLEMLP